MKILGIHDGHNAAACLLEDGVVRAAVQEERLSRVKNHNGFPHLAVSWILGTTGTDPATLDGIALNSRHSPWPKTTEEMLSEYAASDSLGTRLKRVLKKTPARRYHRWRRRAGRLREVEDAGLPRDRVVFVDHHTCHAAAAFYGSPWKGEKVLVLTCDGMGDGLSATVRVGQAGRLHPPLATVSDAHSLGSIYARITFLMGMTPNEHEYKLMGMAPYAPPAGAEACFRRFSGLLVFDGASGMVWRRAPGVPHTYYSHRFFERLIERQRFDCIAAGLQKFTEEHLVRWARNAMAATGVRRLALAGGVFMNVIANKRILELDEVEGLFIFPSCGDETNAVGAAFQVYAAARKRLGEAADVPPLGPIYWGPAPGEPDPGRLAALRRKGYGIAEPDDVEARVAELLAEGEVVARARGPMEFGARALGNRSILADPTHSDLVRRVNDMVKKRDFWMPFAPAILAERSHEYVRNPKGAEAPYMVLAFDTTEKVVDFPAAVQPYDRTARPQFVRRDDNPDFHRLLSCFARRTGRAVLLNTSFNLHGEPIVSSAADALDVLESSGLEHLALGPLLIHKPVRV